MLIKTLAILLLIPTLLCADMIVRAFKDNQPEVKAGKVMDAHGFVSIDSIRPYGAGPKVIIYARRWPDGLPTVLSGTDTTRQKFVTIPTKKIKTGDLSKLKVSGDSLATK